MFDKMKLLCT